MSVQVLDELFPLKASVWPRSLFASIAHAIFVSRAPFLAHEQSWDGANYNVQDSEGSRGTISFGNDKNCFVAVFYLARSERNPIKHGSCEADDAMAIVRDVPDRLRDLYQEALQYVLQDVRGETIPVITAAFWSDLDGPRITACEPWQDVVRHGAVLVKNQMLPADSAIEQLTSDFEFTISQTALTESLFKRRLACKDGVMQLMPAEVQQVHDMANGDAGFDACRESLGEIGIIVP